MFVSVVGDGPEHVVLSDDGQRLGPVYPARVEALDALRQVWLSRAQAHGLALSFGDFRYGDNTYTVDGMDPDEWIVAVCGCYENGGTAEKHVD